MLDLQVLLISIAMVAILLGLLTALDRVVNRRRDEFDRIVDANEPWKRSGSRNLRDGTISVLVVTVLLAVEYFLAGPL